MRTQGDEARQEALQSCGQPNGFKTNIAYGNKRPGDATAGPGSAGEGRHPTVEAQRAAETYYSRVHRKPAAERERQRSASFVGWGPDFPDSNGFWSHAAERRQLHTSDRNYTDTWTTTAVDKLMDEAQAPKEAE